MSRAVLLGEIKDRRVFSASPTMKAAVSSSSAFSPACSPSSLIDKPATGIAPSIMRSIARLSSPRHTGERLAAGKTTMRAQIKITWSCTSGFSSSKTRSCHISKSSCRRARSRVHPTSCPTTLSSPSSASSSSDSHRAFHTIPAYAAPLVRTGLRALTHSIPPRCPLAPPRPSPLPAASVSQTSVRPSLCRATCDFLVTHALAEEANEDDGTNLNDGEGTSHSLLNEVNLNRV